MQTLKSPDVKTCINWRVELLSTYQSAKSLNQLLQIKNNAAFLVENLKEQRRTGFNWAVQVLMEKSS